LGRRLANRFVSGFSLIQGHDQSPIDLTQIKPSPERHAISPLNHPSEPTQNSV
jgi:hypothetical protein